MSNIPWGQTGRREGIMLAYPFEEKRLAKWLPPYIVQPKLDGERCRAVIDHEGVVTLYSSEANVIPSIPHINKAIEVAAQQYSLRDVELDGELYSPEFDLQKIHSIVSSRVSLHPQFEDIQFHVFDLVTDQPQMLRTLALDQFPLVPYLIKVPFGICNSFEEIMTMLESVMEDDYEGIIVRHHMASYIRRRSIFMMKFKPRREDVYKIIGFTQLKDQFGNKREELGALICKSHESEETFNVGTGFDLDTRRSLWAQREDLPGKLVRVKYQHLTSLRGVPRSSVFSEILQEER